MTDADDTRGRPSAGAAPGPATGDDLVSRLARLARGMGSRMETFAVINTMLETGVRTVPGAEHASVSVAAKDHGGETVAATSDLAEQVDDLQYRYRQGPCLDTLFEHVTVRTGDLRGEPRWPVFGPRAADAGIHSMLSVQLFTDDRNVGALNLFAEGRHAFDERSERVALAVAAHGAVAVAATDEIAGLRRAVESRDLIGQAKGILMQRHHLDADTAFAVLVRYSRDTNVKLVELARRVVDGRGLPG